MEDQLAAEMNKLSLQWHSAAAQVTGWDPEESLFKEHSEHARNAYNLVGQGLLPWYKLWAVEEGRSLKKMWDEFRERGKDPEYAAQLKQERERLRELANVTPKYEVMQRAAERSAKEKDAREKALSARKERRARAKLRR